MIVKVKITPWHAYADTKRRQRYSSNPFTTWYQKEVGVQHLTPRTLPAGKTRYPLYRRLGVPWGGLDVMENLAFTRIQSLDHPARSESLYRLHYPCSCWRDINGGKSQYWEENL
jgi:hypothetical protein